MQLKSSSSSLNSIEKQPNKVKMKISNPKQKIIKINKKITFSSNYSNLKQIKHRLRVSAISQVCQKRISFFKQNRLNSQR